MWNSSAVRTGLELALRASFTRDRVYFFEVTGSSLYCVRMVYITKKRLLCRNLFCGADGT